MYRSEREDKFFKYEKESPSFSSSLLDKIYRSIDEDRDKHTDDLRFLREAMAMKKSNRRDKMEEDDEEDEDMARFRRACLIEKWMDKKVADKLVSQRRRHYHHYSEPERPIYADALFFSSTSSSSDSSSGGFSSSDTESMSKSVRTVVAEKKQSEIRLRNVSCYKPQGSRVIGDVEEAMIKSKSRALKIYNNLKKVKQPISPGGKLASFLNSLFASKSANAAPNPKIATAAPFREAAPSTASSFSRSCLSKSTPSSSSHGGLKRSVRFYPVSVIVGEDARPCGHKSIYQKDQQHSVVMPVSVPTAWKIGRKFDEPSEVKVQSSISEKSCRRVEETAREFLRDYRQNQIKNELMIMRDQLIRSKNDIVVPSINDQEEEDDDEDMDDSASYSSSDLFELDHIGKEVRFQEELPVYETTRVHRNRAIF